MGRPGWQIGALVEREVASLALPIDRAAGRGEDEPAVPARSGRLEQVERAGDVDVQVEHRVRDGAPDVDLRGEVEDDLRAALARTGRRSRLRR